MGGRAAVEQHSWMAGGGCDSSCAMPPPWLRHWQYSYNTLILIVLIFRLQFYTVNIIIIIIEVLDGRSMSSKPSTFALFFIDTHVRPFNKFRTNSYKFIQILGLDFLSICYPQLNYRLNNIPKQVISFPIMAVSFNLIYKNQLKRNRQ